MRENMLERVAMALIASKKRSEEYQELTGQPLTWQEHARAAIEAMRMPTKAMHDAVDEMLERENWHMDCAVNDVYHTMIDAALTPSPSQSKASP